MLGLARKAAPQPSRGLPLLPCPLSAQYGAHPQWQHNEWLPGWPIPLYTGIFTAKTAQMLKDGQLNLRWAGSTSTEFEKLRCISYGRYDACHCSEESSDTCHWNEGGLRDDTTRMVQEQMGDELCSPVPVCGMRANILLIQSGQRPQSSALLQSAIKAP